MSAKNTDKLFTIAGTTVYEGVKTFRYANGKMNLRANMLRHFGHENINLHELPKPMTKKQATVWLLENVHGCKGAVIPTRSKDKTAVTALLEEAREQVGKRAVTRAKREARKAEAAA